MPNGPGSSRLEAGRQNTLYPRKEILRKYISNGRKQEAGSLVIRGRVRKFPGWCEKDRQDNSLLQAGELVKREQEGRGENKTDG